MISKPLIIGYILLHELCGYVVSIFEHQKSLTKR